MKNASNKVKCATLVILMGFSSPQIVNASSTLIISKKTDGPAAPDFVSCDYQVEIKKLENGNSYIPYELGNYNITLNGLSRAQAETKPTHMSEAHILGSIPLRLFAKSTPDLQAALDTRLAKIAEMCG